MNVIMNENVKQSAGRYVDDCYLSKLRYDFIPKNNSTDVATDHQNVFRTCVFFKPAYWTSRHGLAPNPVFVTRSKKKLSGPFGWQFLVRKWSFLVDGIMVFLFFDHKCHIAVHR